MAVTSVIIQDGVITADRISAGFSAGPASTRTGCSCRYCGGSSWDRKKRCDGCGAPFPADKVFVNVEENRHRQELFMAMERARQAQNMADPFGFGGASWNQGRGLGW